MKTLFILNDSPYGTERAYNGLRVALALSSVDDVDVRIFLIGDAVAGAKRGQSTPEGAYNIGRMLGGLARRGATIGACGSCLDARGLVDAELVEGVGRSSLTELAEWTLWADRVLTF